MPLHEWKETFEFNYSTGLYDLGTEHSPTTWIFEAGSFVPCGKIVNGKHYSIITDHLGTPIEAYNQEGALIWEREQDLYGNSRRALPKKTSYAPSNTKDSTMIARLNSATIGLGITTLKRGVYK